MPLHYYGLVAASLYAWQLAPAKNVLTIGGSALLGLGAGLLIRNIAISSLQKLYTNIAPDQFPGKIVLVIVGFFSAEVVNTMVLVILSLMDSVVRMQILTMGLGNLAILVHVPVLFWLIYLWQSNSIKWDSKQKIKKT